MMKDHFMQGEKGRQGQRSRTLNATIKFRDPSVEGLLVGMFRELSADKQEVVLDIVSDLYALEKKSLSG